MPYIHWETETKLLEMKDYMKDLMKKSGKEREPRGRNEILLKEYLNPVNGNPLHIRRTLDQYYYYSLEDTKERDTDQVISRMFTRGEIRGERFLMMIDQLWLWILDRDTVITSFPERWSREGKDPEEYDRTDVLENVLRSSSLIKSSHELVELIISECLKSCLDPSKNTERIQFLEVYERSIGTVTDEETKCFKEFSEIVKQDEGKSPNKADHPFLGINREIELLKEIKDIRDELNIMRMLFLDQKKVLEDLKNIGKLIHPGNSKHHHHQKDSVEMRKEQKQSHILFNAPLSFVESNISDIMKMDGHAERTYIALKDLLDLKQKHANVLEARWSRDEAQATRKQGNTIMVFTIVTIVFLPLSFMATFFAINIAEFPKDPDGLHLDYVSKYMFSISAAIVLPLIVLAFNVNQVASSLEKYGVWIGKHKLPATETSARQPTSGPIYRRCDASTSSLESSLPAQHSIGSGNGKTKQQGAGAAITTQSFHTTNKRPGLFIFTLQYALVMLPDNELRFACRLFTHFGKKPKQETQVAQPLSQTKGFVQTSAKQDDSKSTQAEQGRNSNARYEWHVRDQIKVSASVMLGIIRVCIIPFWLSFLLIEGVFLLVAYSILFLFFKDGPFRGMWGWLVDYIWQRSDSKVKSGETSQV